MKITCEICGSYTIDVDIIKKYLEHKENNICPICLTVGSLYISNEKNKCNKVKFV